METRRLRLLSAACRLTSAVKITLKWTNYNNVERSDSGIFTLDDPAASTTLTGAKDEQSTGAALGAIK